MELNSSKKRAEETLRKLNLREGICEGSGVFVELRYMSGQIQKLALELSSNLGAQFVSITIICKEFPMEVIKYCHTVPWEN